MYQGWWNWKSWVLETEQKKIDPVLKLDNK